jgi:hypothetical protein
VTSTAPSSKSEACEGSGGGSSVEDGAALAATGGFADSTFGVPPDVLAAGGESIFGTEAGGVATFGIGVGGVATLAVAGASGADGADDSTRGAEAGVVTFGAGVESPAGGVDDDAASRFACDAGFARRAG